MIYQQCLPPSSVLERLRLVSPVLQSRARRKPDRDPLPGDEAHTATTVKTKSFPVYRLRSTAYCCGYLEVVDLLEQADECSGGACHDAERHRISKTPVQLRHVRKVH